MIIITVAKWFDTVTPESAENGDYASTGNDFRSNSYNNLREAATDYVSEFNNQYWDINDTHVNEVAYATDPDIDYSTGAEERDCLTINVNSDDSIRSDREKRIVRALNYLISKKLSA